MTDILEGYEQINFTEMGLEQVDLKSLGLKRIRSPEELGFTKTSYNDLGLEPLSDTDLAKMGLEQFGLRRHAESG